ncbi:MAG: class I SAM-dependent methyltransferase [Planctomycetes bacterium]|nr:class I SAM-dependent methyltransferase [Planctomycetota bacterium]
MTDKETLRAQWAAYAADWIDRIRQDRDVSRVALLDDAMLAAVGDVAGKRVIDLGCGEGRFGRMLAGRGAEVLGVDLQPLFIEHATASRVGAEKYLVGDMEELEGIPDEAFDLAVSYLSLVDVPNLAAALAQAARVLRPGGRLVACNLAPMATAGSGWIRNGRGEKLHFELDRYFDEGPREYSFPPSRTRITNFHRTQQTMVRAFAAAGLALEDYAEPRPTPEQCRRWPDIADIARVPLFAIYSLRRHVR